MSRTIPATKGLLMPDQICRTCGLNHDRLGVQFVGRLLIRRARSLHRVRVAGGGWAFSAQLIDAHREEIGALQVLDVDSGEVFYMDGSLLARGERRTLNPSYGPQIILPLALFTRTRTRPRLPVPAADSARSVTSDQLVTRPPDPPATAARPTFGQSDQVRPRRRARGRPRAE